ncbi:hypothetical protein B9Z55_007391 [Caenorhabditis nigoni]|uniref:Uncharacterized protein n=1 Tax=Caenorhabditis nigoni TaxID=1611254 RepID=A0A2G5V9J4_9PELO|nr:hypothetical protein B9Z55_007391 [Caenorhabditis nigoni]
MERHPFSIAELLAGSEAPVLPAIGSAPQVPPELLGSNLVPSCILFSHLWNQPRPLDTDYEGSASSASTTPSFSSISSAASNKERIRGIPCVGSTSQAAAGLLGNTLLPAGLLWPYFWNQSNGIPANDEGSASSLSTTPTVFSMSSAGSNKDHQQARSSKQIKRLLLDKRNRQKAKLIPKPALTPGSPECEERYEEALKHHQSSPVQNDIYLADLKCLNPFEPLVPSRAMPQEVSFRACTDRDIYCAWRQGKCAVSSRDAKLEWKFLPEDARKLWKKKEEMVFEEFMFQVKAGFIRYTRTTRPTLVRW